MANRQLVDYVKEQLSHGVNIDQVRTLLIQQGWSQADVESAIDEAYGQHKSRAHKEHGTHFLGIAIAAIVVLILAVALFLIVFKQTEPDVVPQPVPIVEVPRPPPVELSGWKVCAYERDSTAKDVCYQELNLQEDNYDCDIIDVKEERSFCYRAKETVILQRYAEQA